MSPENKAVNLENKVPDVEENQTIGVKRTRTVHVGSEWIRRDEIVTSGPCLENAERQFEMVYAIVYNATMPKLGGLAPTLAVPIMRYIVPDCGCYIECWDQRWSEWDDLPKLSSQSLINCMTLNRLHALPDFKRHLDTASEAFIHLHDDPDDPNGDVGTGGSWQPIGGRIGESDEDGEEGPEESDDEGL